MESKPYPKKDLMTIGKPGPKEGQYLDEIALPLGGIGTGTISLTGRGQLIDWEIQNRPNKGSNNAFSFFTLWAKEQGKKPVAKVLAERPMRTLAGSGPGLFSGTGFGANRLTGSGLPHMKRARFTGRYPFAEIEFIDPDVPLEVKLTAYNPLIPHNEEDSSIPGAVFLFELKNPKAVPVSATVLFNMHNIVDSDFTNYNEYVDRGGVRGINMTSEKRKPESPRWGSMGMFTPHSEVTYARAWVRGAWFENLLTFWDELAAAGEVVDRTYPPLVGDIATLGMKTTIKPGETITLPLYVTWSFPTMEGYWRPDVTETLPDGSTATGKPRWHNHYASRFPDALTSAAYLAKHHDRLLSGTRQFADALFSSTLPDYVLDAVSSQIAVIRSTTCIRLSDGTFYSFEGCHCGDGCCEGSCTHVWNYAQTLAFLFPALERSMREAEYRYNLADDGRMAFRTSVPLGVTAEEGALGGTAGLGERFHPAADGQMGGVMRIYRDYMLTGDTDWLKTMWPSVKKSLEYAWKYWDADKDGVMEGLQHNTYDIEFYGPNTMMGSLYAGALVAAARLARVMGENDVADQYEALAGRGAAWMDKELFNGDYYIQRIDPDADRLSPVATNISMGGQEKDGDGAPKYQFGVGCLSDQLFGQALADLFGLGRLFDEGNVKKALASIFRYNWRADLTGHINPERVFATEGEPGLIICTWPKGGRPRLPFVYADEVMTGFEYQVAVHLINEGLIDEGLSVVRGIRLRYDGRYRNPFNEVECGNHYIRAMANWGLVIALSGFTFDAPGRAYGFAPKINRDNFTTFWSTGTGWGTFTQLITKTGATAELTVLHGRLDVARLSLSIGGAGGAKITKGKEEISGRVEPVKGSGTAVVLDAPVTIGSGEGLKIEFSG
jgi:non-lysosomal glucosylceramidase